MHFSYPNFMLGFLIALMGLSLLAVMCLPFTWLAERREASKQRLMSAEAEYTNIREVVRDSYITLETAAMVCKRLRYISDEYGHAYTIRAMVRAETPTFITLSA